MKFCSFFKYILFVCLFVPFFSHAATKVEGVGTLGTEDITYVAPVSGSSNWCWTIITQIHVDGNGNESREYKGSAGASILYPDGVRSCEFKVSLNSVYTYNRFELAFKTSQQGEIAQGVFVKGLGDPTVGLKITLLENPAGSGGTEVVYQGYDHMIIGQYNISDYSTYLVDGDAPVRVPVQFDTVVEFSTLMNEHLGGGVYEVRHREGGTLSFGNAGSTVGWENPLYEYVGMADDSVDCTALTESRFAWERTYNKPFCHINVQIRSTIPDYLR